MARFDIVDSNAVDYFEVVVETSFAQALTPMEVVTVLQTVTTITRSDLASIFFEGFSRVAITETDLALWFRYAKRTSGQSYSDSVSSAAHEDLSRRKMQFIFFMFATIDVHARLADVPFPADFRTFIHFPDHLDLL